VVYGEHPAIYRPTWGLGNKLDVPATFIEGSSLSDVRVYSKSTLNVASVSVSLLR
jgi:hypothetical protein